MGADFSSRWFFAGGAEAAGARAAVVEQFRRALHAAGLREVAGEPEADRSLVVGPAGRWVFIGDSAGSTEWADPEAFKSLSLALSLAGAVVDVHMSDSAAVHFYLFREGRLADRFGNGEFPFYPFKTEEAAAPYRGKPELWVDLLVSPDSAGALRSVWDQDGNASAILYETGRLFGWDPELLWVGYTFDDEGIPVKYDQVLRGSRVELRAFTEYHFKRSG
jgi:hypothetical protein